MSKIEAKLKELGLELPEASVPVANYVPFKVVGNLVYISGQTSKWAGELVHPGKLGKDLSLEEGREAARICGLNLLVHLRNACGGDLDKVKSCVKLGIFVNSVDTFTDQPLVGNGASDLMVEVFGDKGRHSRAAVSSNSLPGGVSVEVDAIFEVAL